MIDGPPKILLIEDNPGDARLVRELLDSIGTLEPRFDGGIVNPEATTAVVTPNEQDPDVVHVNRLSDGLAELEQGNFDIILLDLNLPDSRGLETLRTVVNHAPTVPIVVLTGIQNREVGLEALDKGAQEYLVKDEINADLLIRTIFHAIQRQQYEQAIERQHDRMAALYKISTLVQDIGGSLIDYSTPTEIELNVCDRLASSGVYQYAWIGEIDRDTGLVTPRAEAVPQGFFDDWSATINEEDDENPIVSAALTEEIQIIQSSDALTDASGLREHAGEFNYRSLAATPIEYEDALYGILVIYADRSDAFGTEERGIMKQLGNVIGHAINAVERKTALMSDAGIELELLLPNFFSGLSDETSKSESRIEFLTTIPAGDGTYLQYARAQGFSEESLKGFLSRQSQFQDFKMIETEGDQLLIEVRYIEQPIISTITTHGGHIQSATLIENDYRVTVDLPADADVRVFIETIRDAYPKLNLVAQRSIDSTTRSPSRFTIRDTSLTEKQRAALEAAYFSGYFDQPRTSKGTDIADSLGITASTFHQHLQAGLRKVLAAEFEGHRSARRKLQAQTEDD